jgi:antagonist of KipI
MNLKVGVVMGMSIKVLDAGLLTTVQDLGRPGYQKDGVPVGGAMDSFSLRMANLLVGNPEGDAGLEMTIIGPTLRFQEDALIAITGADLSPTINGKLAPMWRPIFIKKNGELQFRPGSGGCRAYLGIAGGVQVPKVMGSRSTYLAAGFGGFSGRAVAVHDDIEIGQPTPLMTFFMEDRSEEPFIPAKWAISPKVLPSYSKEIILHLIRGPEYENFTDDALKDLFTKPFKVSPQSNRMGYRLEGPFLKQKEVGNMLSSPVTIGTVQVPSDGQPIILMADCQTTGGYPRIGHIIQADRKQLAQAKPGDHILFRPMILEKAHQLYFEEERTLRHIKKAIEMRFKHDPN